VVRKTYQRYKGPRLKEIEADPLRRGIRNSSFKVRLTCVVLPAVGWLLMTDNRDETDEGLTNHVTDDLKDRSSVPRITVLKLGYAEVAHRNP
jgi:hypothetical protein